MTRSPNRLVWLVIPAVLVAVGFLVVARMQADRPDHRPSQDAPRIADLRDEVLRFASALREDARYRPPGAAERRTLTGAVDRLAQRGADVVGGVAEELRPLGYTTRTGTEARSGRDFVLVANEPNTDRGWGLYVVDLSRPATVQIEVPHPASDLRTEEIGVELFHRVPGAVLSVAGTHRRAADGAGDVAHRENSMFHAVTDVLAGRGLPQVQLHGFDDNSLPGVDVVLSSGAAGTTGALQAVSSRLSDTGLRVCAAWQQDCGELEGRRNQQGIAAAARGTTFVHVELSRTVREGAGRTAKVVDVLSVASFR